MKFFFFLRKKDRSAAGIWKSPFAVVHHKAETWKSVDGNLERWWKWKRIAFTCVMDLFLVSLKQFASPQPEKKTINKWRLIALKQQQSIMGELLNSMHFLSIYTSILYGKNSYRNSKSGNLVGQQRFNEMGNYTDSKDNDPQIIYKRQR